MNYFEIGQQIVLIEDRISAARNGNKTLIPKIFREELFPILEKILNEIRDEKDPEIVEHLFAGVHYCSVIIAQNLYRGRI